MSKQLRHWVHGLALFLTIWASFACQSRRLQRPPDGSVESGDNRAPGGDVGVSTLVLPTAPSAAGALPSATVTNGPSQEEARVAKGGVAGNTDESPGANHIVFVTEGSQFAPVITLRGQAKVRWIWSDGSESDSPRPTKDYGSRGQRRNRLTVEPWSAVQRINIGYDASDGGDPKIERVANQEVSSVTGLSLVAPHLEDWCSSFNPIVSLDFAHFQRLQTIEAFKMAKLREVRLDDTPRLQRACFEETGIRSLNVEDSPALADLRGALTQITKIQFGKAGPNLWHICVRDNPQISSQQLFADGSKFPNVAELFIWKTNQRGTLALHSTHPTKSVEIHAAENRYDTVDLAGALKPRQGWAHVDVSYNAVTRVNIRGCEQIKTLKAHNNRLSTTAVDSILEEIDSWKTEAGAVDLRSNAPPSGKGLSHRRSLESRRWRVEVDGG